MALDQANLEEVIMGDILDVISTRKSIRRYKPDPIPDELVFKVLEAGRWAPTGENDQPWIFIVVTDPETRKRIGELGRIETGAFCTAEYGMGRLQERFAGVKDPTNRERVMRMMYSGETSQIATNAPVIIVVAGTVNALNTPYDLCAAIENMLLEAHALGLGGVWVEGPAGPTRRKKIFKELLGIPTGMGQYHIQAYIAFGWPLEKRKHPRPKKPLEDLVHWEKFGNKERN
jgi:nitroreductase